MAHGFDPATQVPNASRVFASNRALVCLSLVCLCVVMAMVAGCAGFPGPAGAGPTGGNPSPEAPDPEKAGPAAEASNALAFDMLRRLSEVAPGTNVVTAPLSISALLAMLLEGAGGETAEAIAGVLRLDRAGPGGGVGGEGTSASSIGALLRYIAHSDGGVELSIANAIWANLGYPLGEGFVETMTVDFEAEVSELDLGSSRGADAIDGWVVEKTRGRIEQMSDALGLPDPGAVIVLMNAVYFKGTWTSRFDPDMTRDGPFTLADGTEISLPLMSQRGEFEVSTGPGFDLVRLPYGEERRFAMEILVPESGSLIAEFVAGLTPEIRQAAADELSEQDMFLVMPRFELEYEASRDLDRVLQDMGMGIAYSPESDFTPMSPRDPWLSRVAHKTYIRVDEEGSEAAGVTGAVMRESMPAEFRVDRPFVFTIIDTETGAIMFMGVVMNPGGR